MMTKALHTYLDMELGVKAVRMAQREGVSVSQWIEGLIKEEVLRDEEARIVKAQDRVTEMRQMRERLANNGTELGRDMALGLDQDIDELEQKIIDATIKVREMSEND